MPYLTSRIRRNQDASIREVVDQHQQRSQHTPVFFVGGRPRRGAMEAQSIQFVEEQHHGILPRILKEFAHVAAGLAKVGIDQRVRLPSEKGHVERGGDKGHQGRLTPVIRHAAHGLGPHSGGMPGQGFDTAERESGEHPVAYPKRAKLVEAIQGTEQSGHRRTRRGLP